MSPEARRTVAAAAASCGLLLMMRGALLPYFFPLLESVSHLGFAAIAVLLNTYLFATTAAMPLMGPLVDRWPARWVWLTTCMLNAAALAVPLALPVFASFAFSLVALAATSALAQISFNKTVIGTSDEASLRRSASIRATLMTGGSFVGNAVAAWLVARSEAGRHVLLVFGLALAAWAPFMLSSLRLADARGGAPAPRKTPLWTGLLAAAGNRTFLADTLLLCVALVPYGCWGTIIPKYVIDRFGAPSTVLVMYACSAATMVGLNYPFNRFVAPRLESMGVRGWMWPLAAAALMLAGELMLAGAGSVAALGACSVLIALGAVMLIPCMDAAVKRNAPRSESGTYLGLLQFIDGGARLLGSSVAFAIYGALRGGESELTWPVIVTAFVAVATILAAACRALRWSR